MPNQQTQTTPTRSTPEQFQEVNVERVASYDVYDRNNENIGSTTAIWMDRRGQPAFIGVKTTWLFGKTHVVPAYGAEVNHGDERIRLPYTEDDVKNAPSYDPDAELDEAKEREIFTYYRGKGGRLPEWEETSHAEPAERETRTTAATEEARRAATAPRTGEGTTIPLHEEQVKIGKREVEAGGVRLRKIVRSEVVQRPVELKHEEIAVERTPATGRTPRSGEGAFEQKEIYIPLRREEPVIEKEARVREEVHARKTTGAERRTVSGEARKEDVEVEKQRKAA